MRPPTFSAWCVCTNGLEQDWAGAPIKTHVHKIERANFWLTQWKFCYIALPEFKIWWKQNFWWLWCAAVHRALCPNKNHLGQPFGANLNVNWPRPLPISSTRSPAFQLARSTVCWSTHLSASGALCSSGAEPWKCDIYLPVFKKSNILFVYSSNGLGCRWNNYNEPVFSGKNWKFARKPPLTTGMANHGIAFFVFPTNHDHPICSGFCLFQLGNFFTSNDSPITFLSRKLLDCNAL